jgi:hypothetical protein
MAEHVNSNIGTTMYLS